MVQGTVTDINLEYRCVYIDGNPYRFDVTYTTAGGVEKVGGVKNMVVGSGGQPRFANGDVIEYSYGQENGYKFLKFIKKADGASSGGYTPKPQAPRPPAQTGYSAPPDSEKQQMIHYQVAEKVIGDFLTHNPDCINTEDGTYDTITAFVDTVRKYASLLTQDYCMRYGLEYIDKRQGLQ